MNEHIQKSIRAAKESWPAELGHHAEILRKLLADPLAGAQKAAIQSALDAVEVRLRAETQKPSFLGGTTFQG